MAVDRRDDRLLWVKTGPTATGRFRPGAVNRNLRSERAKMIFDAIWDLVLPFAAGRYKTVRSFIWSLLLVAAGLTFSYS